MANNATAELDPRFEETTTYFGRDFQQESLRQEINMVPIDEEEVERLDKQHRMLNEIFRDLEFPPIIAPISEPQDILDCGHGSGSWAVEVAQWLPDSEVVGVDISMQMNPDDFPQNVEFQVADLNEPFTFEAESFDLVNSRFVGSGIAFGRWPSYVADIRRVLRRGGFAQLLEWNLNFRSENGMIGDIQSLQRWSRMYSESLSMTNVARGKKDRNIHQKLEDLMKGAGFERVTSGVKEIPISPWPTDPSTRIIGEMSRENVEAFLRSLALYPVTKRAHVEASELEELVAEAVRELRNLRSRPYLTLHTCWGRKA